MIKIQSTQLKFRGQKLTGTILFLNAVQHCNGKDVIVEFYPYLSAEARKEDSARNHLRHELFFQNESSEWFLFEDLKIETPGHLEFFSKDVWPLINTKVKEYLVGLGICSETDISEV